MSRIKYYYAFMKFVHDSPSGEFVSVGIMVYSPQENFLKFKFRRSLGKLSDALQHINGHHFRSLMSQLSHRAKLFEDEYKCRLEFSNAESSPEGILRRFLPADDSSLQWSEVQTGLSRDLDKTVDDLYDRYAAKYDRDIHSHGKTDEDVWKFFRRNLESRRLESHFEETTIVGINDERKFSLAWKNGIWHCIEPVSFDLKSSETIKDKAYKRAGELVGVSDASNQFKVYLIVARPTSSSLDKAYENAIGIISRSPIQNEVVPEDELGELLDRFGEKISNHKREIAN